MKLFYIYLLSGEKEYIHAEAARAGMWTVTFLINNEIVAQFYTERISGWKEAESILNKK